MKVQQLAPFDRKAEALQTTAVAHVPSWAFEPGSRWVGVQKVGSVTEVAHAQSMVDEPGSRWERV